MAIKAKLLFLRWWPLSDFYSIHYNAYFTIIKYSPRRKKIAHRVDVNDLLLFVVLRFLLLKKLSSCLETIG